MGSFTAPKRAEGYIVKVLLDLFLKDWCGTQRQLYFLCVGKSQDNILNSIQLVYKLSD